jgi:NADH dehydrogenase FAD-containing subunit
MTSNTLQRASVVGGACGDLAPLAHCSYPRAGVTLIDPRNQPLLYQVATGTLSTDQIAPKP